MYSIVSIILLLLYLLVWRLGRYNKWKRPHRKGGVTPIDRLPRERNSVDMDNFYNSFNLAAKLLTYKTYCTGTLRKKKREFNPEIVSSKMKRGQHKSDLHNGIHIGCHSVKRYIPYISTEHDEMVTVTNKRRTSKEKLKASAFYKLALTGQIKFYGTTHVKGKRCGSIKSSSYMYFKYRF